MKKIFEIITPKQLKAGSVLFGAVLYLLFFWIGMGMISEYKKYGYYIDYKHHMQFSGEGAKITGYGVTVAAGIGIVYTLYLIIVLIYRKIKKNGT